MHELSRKSFRKQRFRSLKTHADWLSYWDLLSVRCKCQIFFFLRVVIMVSSNFAHVFEFNLSHYVLDFQFILQDFLLSNTKVHVLTSLVIWSDTPDNITLDLFPTWYLWYFCQLSSNEQWLSSFNLKTDLLSCVKKNQFISIVSQKTPDR